MGFPPQGLGGIETCAECSHHPEGFFCQLASATKEAFERIKFSTVYPKGAIMYAEGQPPRGVYMLCKGRVKLSVCAADGKGLILQLVEAGEILGLPANISNHPFEVTAEAIEPCQIDFVERDSFLAFLQQHNDACFRVAERLSQKYHAAYGQVRSLGLSHSALEKLARLLLDWCAHDHPAEGNADLPCREVRMKLGLTHEEIARMIGTSRETVSRLFRELKDRDAISLHGSTLIVRDRGALERLISA